MEFAINSCYYVNLRLNIKQYIGEFDDFTYAKLAVIVQSNKIYWIFSKYKWHPVSEVPSLFFTSNFALNVL